MAVGFKPLLVAEVHMLPCRAGYALGSRTTPVNEERLQARIKIWVLATCLTCHLPLQPGWSQRWASASLLPEGLRVPPATTPGASSPGQTLLPATSVSQSCPRWGPEGRAGVVGAGEDQTCGTGRQQWPAGRRWSGPGTRREQKPVSALAVPGPSPSCLGDQGMPSCNATNCEAFKTPWIVTAVSPRWVCWQTGNHWLVW